DLQVGREELRDVEDPQRVDDPEIEQRRVVGDSLHLREPLDEERTQLRLDLRHPHLPPRATTDSDPKAPRLAPWTTRRRQGPPGASRNPAPRRRARTDCPR